MAGCGALPASVRQYLVFILGDIPPGVSRTELTEAASILRPFGRAIAKGLVRDDVSGEDVLLALVGMCMMRKQPDWRDGAIKMTDILVDGMLIGDAGRSRVTVVSRK